MYVQYLDFDQAVKNAKSQHQIDTQAINLPPVNQYPHEPE